MSVVEEITGRVTVEGPLPDHTFVVDTSGPEDGTPVVFLHGEFGAFDELPLSAGVTEVARVLAIHLPGWGESAGGDRFLNLGELATAIWWCLDQLGVDRTVVCGHGVGATIAVEMAVQQPARLSGLCVAAPYGLFRVEDPGLDLFGTLPKELMSSMYEDVEGAVALRHFPAPADAYERGLTSIRRVIVLGTASRYLFPIPDTGIADRLYRLSPVPTVALFGGSDRLVPRSLADDWRTLAPRADVRVIDEALHMHPYERSDFSEAVSALVSEAAGAG